MTLVQQLDQFLLTSRVGRTLFGPVVSTGAAVLLGLSFDRQPFSVQVVRLTLLPLVLSTTWYGVTRSELERAAREARSRDLENRFEALIDEATYRILERAERAEEAAVGALRSSLCGLEAQAASADVAAATTARAYLALLEREGLTADLGQASDGLSDEGLSQ